VAFQYGSSLNLQQHTHTGDRSELQAWDLPTLAMKMKTRARGMLRCKVTPQ
jgi:hypothetical protein